LNLKSRTLLAPVIHREPAVSVALDTEVLGIDNAPRGVIGIEMSGVGILGSAAPGGAASDPRSLGAMHLELPGAYLIGSSDTVSPPVNWRQVESEAELARSQVTTMERLLHQTLALVHHNILHPFQVNLGKTKRKNPPHIPNGFLCAYLLFSHLTPKASISRQHRCYRPIGRGGLGARGHHHCRGRLRCGHACHRDFCSGSRYGVEQCRPSYQGC
jgi:hypothetical protein